MEYYDNKARINPRDFTVTYENTYVTNIAHKVSEDYDDFIFETLSPFCEEVTQQKISKQELKFALLHYKKLEEENKKLIEKCNQLEEKAKKLEHMVDKLLNWIKNNE
jgi:DNA-binding transcriptional regulator YhcF (GntR family)